MGYRRERRIIRLVFEDEELAGLEVRARSVSLGRMLDLLDLADRAKEQDRQAIEHIFRMFADALESWNLEDENDTPVPLTYEGLLGQDTDFVMDLVLAWKDGVAGIRVPLDQPSSDGSASQTTAGAELLIPMEPLSASLAS